MSNNITLNKQPALARQLKKYKTDFEKALQKQFLSLASETRLLAAVKYCLVSGGKRLRPMIVLLIAEAVGSRFDAMQAALAVEFFHSASLIADDLPCMDNEEKRRSKPSLHKAFGESTAVLASYALISSGYELIYKNAESLKKKRGQENSFFLCYKALQQVSELAGISGAVEGQFLDLFPPDYQEKTVFKVMQKKTASLFELSFALGFLFGGGAVEQLNEIKMCGRHLGMAFQLADDIADFKQDNNKQQKNPQMQLNAVSALGYDKTKEQFEKQIKSFEIKIKKLGLSTPALDALVLSVKGLV